MRRGQTATEYLVILAVVITIALVTISTLGEIPSFGQATSQKSTLIQLQSLNVGVTSYVIGTEFSTFTLKNNLPRSIRLNNFVVNQKECLSSPLMFSQGESKTFNCNKLYTNGPSEEYDLHFWFNYTDIKTSANYLLNRTEMKLTGISVANNLTGLLDVYSSASAAYSLRKLSQNTTYVILGERQSDSSLRNFTWKELVDGTISSWSNNANVSVRTWYDQSSNNIDLTQTSQDKQPLIVINGEVQTEGGVPTLDFNGNFSYSNTLPNQGNSFTILFASRLAAEGSVGQDETGNKMLFYSSVSIATINANNRLRFNQGNADIWDSSWYTDVASFKVYSFYADTNDQVYANSILGLNKDLGTTSLSGNFYIGINPYIASHKISGTLSEFIVFNNNLIESKNDIQEKMFYYYSIN